ncbi:hypothetical protein LTR99_008550 [Exophiala xenobiotica]|uniref:Amine oxidase n=1 Tax=Vermiconidia calcicola TaxID=1690605 RepID=A0AAV9Q306_9PEZI|nr:hypothetical protein LTR99_008550 [Exophiala xenobiotica]KAK5428661.1 hypothetical protein LTR34_007827 [Exophiala xenobiotica]KAK5532940.1 hypothetical protein LTR25_007644 [Vermiconidia calcicola]KAK5546670.1 hypothetical protein LTR23_003417 [Chaetothyriales sp. CCFEE 6169]
MAKALLWLWLWGSITAVSCQPQYLTASRFSTAASSTTSTTSSTTSKLDVSLRSTLVPATDISSAVRRVMQAGQVQDLIRDTNHRLIQVDNLYGSGDNVKRERNSFRAVIADYTNGRTVYAGLDDAYGPLSELSTEISNVQHVPNHEEILEAAEIAGFGRDAVYHLHMPPVFSEIHANGSSSRVINMIAHSKDETKFTSVHVDMHLRTASFIQPAKHAATTTTTKTTTTSAGPACTGILADTSNRSPIGSVGAVVVQIKQGSTLLWELVVIRPSASKGSKGSGIELLNVRYRNKLVLKRAHVPILNVNYLDKSHVSNGCGPYFRDWQNEEFPFTCDGDDEKDIPEFRRCKTPSKTIVDKPANGPQKDGGNFLGVAFDIFGDEVVIRSQLSAVWYRYTTEWRLAANGTIMPRWGFGGVRLGDTDPCVCIKHHHHVYWRLDFDIETSTSNVFRECDSPGTCTNVEIEKQLYKKQNRRWEVANSVSGNYYQLYPGKPDGAWNPNEPKYPTEDLEYGVGDLWLARYDSSDAKHVYDDGVTGYGGRFDVNARINTRADFSKILKNFDAKGQDIVVWYSAHFMHNQMHDVGDTHVVGPNLVPGKWQ